MFLMSDCNLEGYSEVFKLLEAFKMYFIHYNLAWKSYGFRLFFL